MTHENPDLTSLRALIGVWCSADGVVETWLAGPDQRLTWTAERRGEGGQRTLTFDVSATPPAGADTPTVVAGEGHLLVYGVGGDGPARYALSGDRLTVCDGGAAPPRELHRTRVKQVICYRRDLKMRKGKIAAQCAHASMAVLTRRGQGAGLALTVPLTGPEAWWVRGPFAKVVLSVEDEQALLTVAREAEERGLPVALITDSGRTEFGGVPTRTTVAVGPAPVSWVDEVTGVDGVVATKLA